MGGVRLFGRRWSVSTDDFVFSSITELFLRSTWLIILLVITFYFVSGSHCDSLVIYKIFCYGLASSLIINLPLTTGLLVSSARGSIIRDRQKRMPWVPFFLYAKLIIYAVEIGWVSFGFYWAFYDEKDCEWSSVVVVRIMVVAALIVAIFNAITVLIIFDPLGSADHSGPDHVMKTHKVWERRCRILCCGCAPKDREKDAFTSIANILTDYFVDMDLTPSDIAAGLLLLRRRQEGEIPNSGVVPLPVTSSPTDDNLVWSEIPTISYFMKYAVGCYGWPIYMMMNFCTGCCRLCGLCRCCCNSCQSSEDFQIVDDNGCECNFAAVLKVTGLPRSQFLYVTFHNDLFESPYYVAVDHDKKTIIVAVRGSLSASDGLTDLTAVVGCLEPEGHPSFVVHGGILQSARYISQRLVEGGVLEKAFTSFPEYRLVLCGHSLGAGIVSVLAVLLSKRFPSVRAYAFSPPLGLMNKEMSDHCKDFVISVALGYDLVPHLSIRNMYRLKQSVLDELVNTDQAKYKVLSSGVFRLCCGGLFSSRPPRSPSNGDPLLDTQNINGRMYSTLTTDDAEFDGGTNANRGTLLADQPDMQFAGRMLHIVDVNDTKYPLQPTDEIYGTTGLKVEFEEPNDLTSSTKGFNCAECLGNSEILFCMGIGKRRYKAVWSNADNFKEIIIHPRMLTDHLPDRVQSALHFLVQNEVQPLQVEDVSA